LFGIPGDRLTDRIVPLEDLWGKRALHLLDRLAAARTFQECAAILTPPRVEPLPVERVIAWIDQRHGCVTMDQVARECGISPRQLRRTFLEQTGLSPKFLARVLRFRHAVAQAPRAGGDFAGLALDCGYYDQAHLIRDFREFAGRTPTAYAAGRFLQSEDRLPAVAS
jgi:AraC-like DNA-binding protein